MQLSPLQSRLAASAMASCLLLCLYLFLYSPPFAAALEINPAPSSSYEPEFALFDRGIVGHTVRDTTAIPLTNNAERNDNVPVGQLMTYSFSPSSLTQSSRSTLELRDETREEDDEIDDTLSGKSLLQRRQTSNTLYISANTCVQPERQSANDASIPDPAQLVLYVSTSSDNTSPGPDQDDSVQTTLTFDEGAVMHKMELPDYDVYISIAAPNISAEQYKTDQNYNVNVAFSVDKFFYYYYSDDQTSELVWVDSDDTATLLTTQNLTDAQRDLLPSLPYSIVANGQSDLFINGMRNSFCGLDQNAAFRPLDDGDNPIQTGQQNGSDGLITQQFYLDSLSASSKYVAFLVQQPDSTAQTEDASTKRGGGTVFRRTEFETKPVGTCTVIYNLTLCNELQYAVPGNDDIFPNVSSLANFYDNYTQTMYNNFEKSLQQIPCEADSTEQYSLARGCDDCRAAYKNWLCTVSIPRCEDFSQANETYLQIRNINDPFPDGSFVDQSLRDQYGSDMAYNSSRNPQIDEVVKPGPYKEVLPCDDVCYNVVQSCPSALGFNCPLQHMIGFNTTYGLRTANNNKTLSCNWQRSAYYPSATDRLSTPLLTVAMALLLATIGVVAV